MGPEVLGIIDVCHKYLVCAFVGSCKQVCEVFEETMAVLEDLSFVRDVNDAKTFTKTSFVAFIQIYVTSQLYMSPSKNVLFYVLG